MASTAVQIRPAVARARLDLKVGDVVVVRPEAEILATLDERGELDALPFMPEMLQFCGKQFTVDKVAHKLCDTMTRSGMRRMRDAVHLAGVRCDAEAHGGCQTACLFYWKEAWLERAGGGQPAAPAGEPKVTAEDLYALATRPGETEGEVLYTCQATELLRAAPELLPFKDVRQYVDDVRSGNAGVLEVVRAVLVGLFNYVQNVSTRVLPRRLWFREGLRWRFVKGTLTKKTPTGQTDLQPGELVRIKSQAEIEATLNQDCLNRGLGFEMEMARQCGREARVLRRVDRCIEESTGRMLQMKNPCIVLEGVICEGRYNAMCPRSIYAFWREIWLVRVEEPVGRGSVGTSDPVTEPA